MRSNTSFTYEFMIFIVRLDNDIWLLIAFSERLTYTFHERFGLRCALCAAAALRGALRGEAIVMRGGGREKGEWEWEWLDSEERLGSCHSTTTHEGNAEFAERPGKVEKGDIIARMNKEVRACSRKRRSDAVTPPHRDVSLCSVCKGTRQMIITGRVTSCGGRAGRRMRKRKRKRGGG
ncbi:hypothetical protein JKF63_05722 [Porcisia hertigi]|uniref:Uncharacterized protein n=1 Tax=Porcisia hertigi TaxID=2761500 RepID=A0A836LCB1_9TRYP|nr:hypothetical protein JKF63_05722 [Porcisia hertigi]